MKNKYFVWAFIALGIYSIGFGIIIPNWPSLLLGVVLLVGIAIAKYKNKL